MKPENRRSCDACQETFPEDRLEALIFRDEHGSACAPLLGQPQWVYLCQNCLGQISQQAIDWLDESDRSDLYREIVEGRVE